MIDRDQLVRLAYAARDRAYAPYSSFPVGAALLSRNGHVYVGCNVENVSLGLTVCAERVALFKAVSEGEREFLAIAVVSATGATPCGACRQVLHEFAPSLEVIVAKAGNGEYTTFTLRELLPHGFESFSGSGSQSSTWTT